MGNLRDHAPIIIEEFGGLFQRSGPDSCPIDHFQDCNNLKFLESGIETRDGIDTFVGIGDVVRMYEYRMDDQESLLLLNQSGQIYHALLNGSDTIHGPILTIATMEDFGFQSWAGRAYITPFKSYTDTDGHQVQKGIENEFVYVYLGDGTAARKAAGDPPSAASAGTHLIAFNSSFDGVISKGIHLVSVISDLGVVLAEVFPVVYAPGGQEIELINVPLGAPGTAFRTVILTRAVDPKNYVPNQASYTYYNALVIADNTTTYARLSLADSALTAPAVVGALPSYTGLKAAASSTQGGHSDIGFHLFGVVYETDTGYLTSIGPENFASLNMIDLKKGVSLTNIPVSAQSFVTKRHIVATKAIYQYNGDQTAYQFFFVPDGTIEDNTGTTLTVNFYDADLFDDASHLMDNFSEIPAGVRLTVYNGRMVLTTTFDDPSLVYLSAPSEPEAFDQVDGLIIVPPDGLVITNAQALRDVLYVFKKTRTFAAIDNADEPSTWSISPVDEGIGASVHGIGTILDSGGVNIEFLLVADFSGLMLFSGTYARPELTWKIRDLWRDLDFDDYNLIEVYNNTLQQEVYVVLPDGTMLLGDYDYEGLDGKNIRWCPWSFQPYITSISIVNTDTLVLAAKIN